MHTSIPATDHCYPQFVGLRMTADEFLQVPEDGHNYELIDGVVVVSPSPKPLHQHVTGQVYRQLADFLDKNPAGLAFVETDVHLGERPTGGDVVYRPELIFIRSERLPEVRDRVVGAPDVAVEVVSRGSRRFDSETKKNDYQRFGVREYWLIDPDQQSMTFYRLEDGCFVEVSPEGDGFASQVIPGFTLDLARVRKAFKPW